MSGSESSLAMESETTTLSPTIHNPQSTHTDSEMANAELVRDELEEERRAAEVTQLARRLTHASVSSTVFTSPLAANPDPALDPKSRDFSPRAWSKAMLRLQSTDEKAHPMRTSGFSFRNLNVYGFGTTTDYQKSVGNVLLEGVGFVRKLMGVRTQHRIDILRNMEGLVESGELLVVLGPPGSGCSTFLKTISGETHGFKVDEASEINYKGIGAKQMAKDFRGEAIYTAEVDVHFPMLSVGDTLLFAAHAREPRHVPGGVSKDVFAKHLRDIAMAIFGISHTINTRVGNDYVRGVSGGERKRVSIAEAALSGAPLQCWDNSTRGLDSANAVEFCKNLRVSSDTMGATACVAIYQAPQSAYDIFDKVLVIYEGRQIYFGRTGDAQRYFEELGFDCPSRQTTADFLTSMTSSKERVVRPGWEKKVPRTPDDFAEQWKSCKQRMQLLQEIKTYESQYPVGGESLEKFKTSRRAQQARNQRVSSPYTLSYTQQVRLCLWRGFRRLIGDPSVTLSMLIANFVTALIVGSVFYNLRDDTGSFYSRGALIFFAILMNAFGSALEILTLYAQRPIVEKHYRYALYHPSCEAFASMLTDIPYKITNAFTFNITLYFMTNLRREAGAFFFFVLISFTLTLTMSMLFRSIASLSKTLSQALAPAAVLILAIVIYTGFTIPVDYMLGWSRWINYLDPVAYGFESLLINEFHNRNFDCSKFVPAGPTYQAVGALNRICSVVGSEIGVSTVSGDAYLESSFGYTHSHKWRNLGIMIAFTIGLCCVYLTASELVTAKKSKGEVLVFPRGHNFLARKSQDDEESEKSRADAVAETTEDETIALQRQTAIFHWKDVCYDIKIKGEPRRILDHVDGWVKPGTLTALMGVSGAGKTTLLDCLATRTSMGVITGEMLVDGRARDDSFQRKTGYVQQQDLHLSTSTVREALNFSALLRQHANVPRQEKLAYVDEVIKLLGMVEYADAVVGVPGEGLNVEQRKRLTIGVELAAKPALLLFLDEPTSGLDSQTSWAILDLLEKLTKLGQAVLCTIHQPSAMLFQRFDRLLFLAKGGKTVYFGDIGKNSSTLTNYFERNGGHACPPGANPAEWMLDVIGAAPGSRSEIDWFQTWRNSPEKAEVWNELARLKEERPHETALQRTASAVSRQKKEEAASFSEFAAPFRTQLIEVTKRVFEQYWRTPSYIYAKALLCVSSAIFIGFSFYNASNSIQGLQDQMFSIFMLFTIFGQLAQQIMPHFVTQRSLYEVRERPSKAYSWKAFMLSNIFVELPWNSLMAVLIFFCFYYPIGLYRNAEPTDTVSERGFLMFLFVWTFLLFTSTFAHMAIAAIESAESGGNVANLCFSLCLIFCGVLAGPSSLPGFWIFMYRVSPFSYLISGMLSTAVANTDVVCAANEYLHFNPTTGTCGDYMKTYIAAFGGYLEDANAIENCSFCTLSDTNAFLKSVTVDYGDAWRNFGLMWVYIIFNVFAALGLYWLVRVPKVKKEKEDKKKE